MARTWPNDGPKGLGAPPRPRSSEQAEAGAPHSQSAPRPAAWFGLNLARRRTVRRLRALFGPSGHPYRVPELWPETVASSGEGGVRVARK